MKRIAQRVRDQAKNSDVDKGKVAITLEDPFLLGFCGNTGLSCHRQLPVPIAGINGSSVAKPHKSPDSRPVAASVEPQVAETDGV